jgi:O-antigen/teichoic acid export membrane protein
MIARQNSAAPLTSNRHLAASTLLNMIGQGVPILVGIVAMPLLIRRLGIDRFGVLSLIWVGVGYFSLFDMGLSRALTKLVAARLGRQDQHDLLSLVITALLLMSALGVICASIIWVSSSWLTTDVLRVPAAIQSESFGAIRLMALVIPIVICTAGLRGVLEAYQRFDLANLVNAPLGAYTFLGPLLITYFSSSLVAVVGTLLVGRIGFLIVYLRFCLRLLPAEKSGPLFRRDLVKPLFLFGQWITVSNFIISIFTQFDRFLIGVVASVADVAYYGTPADLIRRAAIFPGALATVLFPALSTSLESDRLRVEQLFALGVKAILVVMFPISLILVGLAHEGLTLWLGEQFADKSTTALQILAFGLLINSLAIIPYVFIQASNRPDITARFHLVELPLYLAMLWGLLRTLGITGAAAAWTLRVTLDALLLFGYTRRLLQPERAAVYRWGIISCILFGDYLLVVLISSLPLRIIGLISVLVINAWGCWQYVLSPAERSAAKAGLRRWWKKTDKPGAVV